MAKRAVFLCAVVLTCSKDIKHIYGGRGGGAKVDSAKQKAFTCLMAVCGRATIGMGSTVLDT